AGSGIDRLWLGAGGEARLARGPEAVDRVGMPASETLQRAPDHEAGGVARAGTPQLQPSRGDGARPVRGIRLHADRCGIYRPALSRDRTGSALHRRDARALRTDHGSGSRTNPDRNMTENITYQHSVNMTAWTTLHKNNSGKR